jgi:hypothetical protein
LPTIELKEDTDDGARILSCMYFPTHTANRGRWFSALHENEDQLTPDIGRPISDQGIDHQWVMTVSDAGWRGTVSGEILLRLALMRAKGTPEPSVRKAVYSMHVHAVQLITNPDTQELSDAREDKAIPITVKSMWNFLRSFKTVCHLWAAHRILERSHALFHIPALLRDGEQLRGFLCHAAWFLEVGASHKTRNDKAMPPLDRASAWVPSAAFDAVEPPLGDFPESLREALQAYRVPKKK